MDVILMNTSWPGCLLGFKLILLVWSLTVPTVHLSRLPFVYLLTAIKEGTKASGILDQLKEKKNAGWHSEVAGWSDGRYEDRNEDGCVLYSLTHGIIGVRLQMSNGRGGYLWVLFSGFNLSVHCYVYVLCVKIIILTACCTFLNFLFFWPY